MAGDVLGSLGWRVPTMGKSVATAGQDLVAYTPKAPTTTRGYSKSFMVPV